MLNKFTKLLLRLNVAVLLSAACMLPPYAQAAVVSDDFTLSVDNNDWTALGYACLTAGAANNGGSIKGCGFTTPDASGSGALRLTPSVTYQRGGIVSNYTFPTNQGLQVTFTTYTYGGDSGGTAGLGADGMSFFLMDGNVGVTLGSGASAVSNLGGSGGALSYSCSNGNSVYSGLTGAYLGLGMDEYGNFLNDFDNTSTGIANQSSSSGSNGYNGWSSSQPNYQPNRIGLRGAGNVSWYWLNQNYPLLYPSSLGTSAQATAVQTTCKTGYLWDYGSAVAQTITSATVSGTTMTVAVPNAVRNNNGDSVTIGGTITAANPVQNISSASVSGTTLTFTASGGSYSSGSNVTIGGTITATPASQTITSFSGYNNSAKTVNVNIANTSSFTVGGYVYISGISGGNGYPNNAYYTISSLTTNSYLVLSASSTGSTFTSSLPSVNSSSKATPGTTAATPVSIASGYTTISGTSGSTVKVSLSTSLSGATISNTSGTVTLTPPTVTGNYTISNVTSTGFDVTLASSATSIVNTSGSVLDTSIPGNSGRKTSTQIPNYAAIPGGYWVLPSTQPIAKESAATRSQAIPITYKLMITPAGNLNFWYSYNGGAYQQVLPNFPITTNNGALPSSFRFGFTGATGGSRNYHDITCFLAEPVTSASSAGGNSVQSGQFKTSTQLYIASYDSYFWTGSVTALPIVTSSSGVVGVGTATWDGNCVLTGGGCATTTVATTAQAPSSRQILTWNGTQGVPFQWSASTSTSTLSAAQQTVLNSTDSAGQNRLNWLRGDRTNELTANPPGVLRARAGLLGDVVDSSPTWVGPPSLNYGSVITDTLYSSAGSESSHATFNSNLATRTNVVYVGGNDGMLHGFRSGSNFADGTYNSNNNDGTEVLGFVPSSVLADSRVVGLTSQGYGHDYFVDATPGYGDLYYGGAWHTWLVSGIGPGGKEIFALDITNPDDTATTGSTKFLESNAANIVKGDWTSSSITTCTSGTTTVSNCGNNLGYTYGTPLVRRLHNGKWAIIFGNGYGSSTGRAGVFVGVVAPTTTTSPAVTAGSVSFYWLDTGSSASNNGLAYVSSADLDGDHVIDYLYAGDLQGKLWRFDLTSSNPADWAVSKYGQSAGTPLYDAGSTHPITTQIATTVIALTGLGQRVVLGFGTGRGIPFTMSTAETYASGTQSVYGIWDWDMADWNNGRTTANSVTIAPSSSKYAYLAQITTSPYRTIASTDLLSTNSTLTTSGSTGYTTTTTVCWQGSSACSTGNNKYGWMFDFPNTGEQLIYSPKFEGGALVMNTTIPPGTAAAGQCTPATTTGWTRTFDMGSGGGFNQSVFADSTGSFAVTSAGSATAIKQNSVGQPFFFTWGSKRYLASPDVGGGADVNQFNSNSGITIKRLSWEQIR